MATKKTQMNSEQIHFVVLAPLDIEIKALSNVFGFDRKKPEIAPDGVRWYEIQLRCNNSTPINVRIVNLIRQGALNAAICTTKLVLRWNPWCVVSFGIAGGFVGDDINLRDVLIADSVFYYEPAKETVRMMPAEPCPKTGRKGASEKSKIIPIVQEEPSIFNTSSSISSLAYGQSPPARRTYKICLGPLASGEKLIAYIQSPSRKRILKLNRHMLAVEKEAAGVAATVRDFPEIPDLQLLVVKGISDDATIAKNEQDKKKIARDRNAAARNAAEILRMALVSSNPPTRDMLTLNTTRKAMALSEKALKILPSHIVLPPNLTDLARVVWPLGVMPPVYYHWRALTDKLHWVDFCVLRVLNRLREYGFQVCPLVTEGMEGKIPKRFSREEYNKIVYATVGAHVTWYTEILDDRVHYVRYAEANGLGHEGLNAIREKHHHWGLKSGKLVLEEWLQYVAWASRHVGRCVILTYAKHIDAYTELRRVLTLTPLILGVNIQIGGKPGKFEPPWRDIHIEPPNYDSILAWIKTNPPVKHVQDFCRYVSLDCKPREQLSLAEMVSLENMPGWQELGRILGNNQDRKPFGEAVSKLAAHLRQWNKTLFHGILRPGLPSETTLSNH